MVRKRSFHFKSIFESPSQVRRPLPATRKRPRLLLEALEERTLLSVVKWTGADTAVSTNWSDANNWSSDTSPVAGDTVVFDNSAQNSVSTIDASYVSGGALAELQIGWGGAITIAAGVTLSAQNTELSTGTVNAAGALTVSGALTWLSGTMRGTGTVNANGTLVLGAGDGNIYDEVLNGCTLNNAGSGSWLSEAGFFDQQNGSVFNNLVGASFAILSPLAWNNDQGNSTFNNAGSVTEMINSGASTFNEAFNNSGSVLVQSGTLLLAGGGSDSGSFSVPAGKLEFDDSSTTITTTSTAGISGAGTVEFGVGTVDTAGTYNVSGTTLVDGGNNGGTVNFTGATPATIQSLTITNGGTLTATGTVNVAGALTWLNGRMRGTGTVNANGTLVLGAGDGNIYDEVLNGCTLNNAGSGSWLSEAGFFDQQNGSVFNNLVVASFAIQSPLAWNNDQGNSTFNNAGSVTEMINSGTSTFNEAFNNSGSVLVQSGTLLLAGGGSDSGSFSVPAGTLEFDDSSTTITTTSTAGISGAGTVEFGVGTVDTSGVFSVSGTTLVDGGNNGGTVNFTGATSVATQSLTITNGGTANFSGTTPVATQSLTLSGGGTLTGSATVNVSGPLTWLSGTMSGTGSVNANGTLVIGAADGNTYEEYLNGCTLNNAGSGSWLSQNGYFDQDGSVFNNLAGASFTIQSALSWYNFGTKSTFDNAGSVIEAAGSGTSTFNAAFNNSGTLQVLDGTLDLDGGGSSLQFDESQVLIVGPLATVTVPGNLVGATTNADEFAPSGTVILDGQGSASAPQLLEVMSQDDGAVPAGFKQNFAYGTLALGNTYVQLVDNAHNSSGTGPEALYVTTLLVPAGCTLDLNGLHVYAQAAQVDGTVVNGTIDQMPPGGSLVLNSSNAGIINSTYPTNDWTFFGRANQDITVVVNPGDPNNPPSPLQPSLGFAQVQLEDASGNVLASQTSAQADGDANLLGVALPADGTYQVIVSPPASQPASTGHYEIGVFDATIDTNDLNLDQSINGQLYTGYEINNWTFSAQANDAVKFNLLNESSSGIEFDLTGPNGYTAFSNANTSSDPITLPTSGSYVLTVHSTAGDTGAYAFNLTHTSQTALTLRTTYQGSLQGSGQAELFTVNVAQAGNPLLVDLLDTSSVDQNELYLQLGSPPTRSNYQYRYSNLASADQQIVVSSAAAGTWYILLYGKNVPVSSSYSLVASTASVVLTAITPLVDGTSAATVMTLTGAGFDNTTAVELVASNGTTTYAASAVVLDSPTQMTATFTAGAVPPGQYSVSVLNAGGSSGILPNAFTMTQGGEPNLVTNVIVPNPIGFHVPSTIYVEYSNTGDVAMRAPLLLLSATMNGQAGALLTLNPALRVEGQWTSATPAGFGQSVQILAGGANPGWLEPGESVTVPVYYAGWLLGQWDFSRPPIYFTLGVLTTDSTTAIDWDSLKSSLQPPGLSAQAWNAIYGNLTAQMGSTWGAFLQRLDQDASYLGSLGESVTDISQLWSFEVQQASGFNPMQILSTMTDAQVATPGLPLSVDRTFPNYIDARSQLGPFGFGWNVTDAWEQALTVANGMVTIIQDGMPEVFEPDSRGGYFSMAGVNATLTAESGGGFLLQDADGQMTAFNSNDQLAYIQDTNGNTVTAGYTSGLLTSLTASTGQSLTFVYNSAGRITSITDSTGRTTTYTYDPTNQYLLSVTDFAGRTTTYAYDTSGVPATQNALLSVQNPDGTIDEFTYNAEGRLAQTYTANASIPGLATMQVTYAYGPGGEVAATDADGGTTQYFFDPRGIVVKVVNPLGNATHYVYDNNYNLTQVVDPAGQVTNYAYDQNGNIIRSTNPDGATVSYTYAGPFNNLTSSTDPNGNTTNYAYDNQGDLLSISYPNQTEQQFSYDPVGNMTETIDGNGQAIRNTYNSMGLPTEQDFADGTKATYTYDGHGNMLSATNSTGTTTFQYDPLTEDLLEVSYPGGFTLTFQYDSAGRRIQSVDQSGFTVNYSYNSAGRLAALTDGNGSSIVSYTYDAAGYLIEKDAGNGTSTTYQYDLAGDILHLVNSAPGGSVNSRFDYTYNSLGLQTSMTALDGVWTYQYDPAGQLTQAIFASNNPNVVPNQNLQYLYDPAGNRTETIINGVTTLYVTNNLNEYTSVGADAYRYDADGNLIAQTGPGGTSNYTYDDSNQLVGAATPGGAWSYQYDLFGNRIASTQNGQTTQYVIDPTGQGNPVGEYDGAGSLIAHYAYGLGLTSRVDATGAAAYYDFDALGSTVGLSGPAGSYLNRYSYLPFGGMVNATATVPNAFQYVGAFGVMAEGNGLSFMRARYYSPASGSFISEDPIGLGGGDSNLHRYVQNNPVEFVDPLGTFDPVEGIREAGCALLDGLAGEFGGPFIGLACTAAVGGEPDNMVNGIAGINRTGTNGSANGAEGGQLGGVTGPTYGSNSTPALPPPGMLYVAKPHPQHCDPDFYFPGGPSQPDCPQPPPPAPPTPPPNPRGRIPTQPVTSVDPNALYGPTGYGSAGFVSLNAVFPYRIDFENAATATAPAQRVVVTDQLDANLDWSTFQLTGIGFGDTNLSVPADTQDYQASVPMTYNGQNFDVDVSAELNAATGLVTVTFQSIDPNTDLPPANVLTGFLPPENSTGRGDGYVSFIIDPKSNLPTGTQVRNVALISFDDQLTIATDQVNDDDPSQGVDPTKQARVTIDAGPPTSSVSPLPAFSPPSFTVSWSGQDDAGGSGIASYDIYVSDNGGAVTPFQQATTQTSATFTGQAGHTYAFYSVATDSVGNVQLTPTGAQTSTMVASVTPTVTGQQANQDFIGRMYQDLLGRPADSAGLANWTNLLDQGSLTRTQVVSQVTASQEYESDVVKNLYQKVLRRDADQNGLSFFTNVLAHGGSAEQVEAQLLGSAEYFSTRGGGTNAGFLGALYQDVLHRAIEANGLQTWMQALAKGASRTAVATAVLGNLEAETDEVQYLYQELLHRPVDTGGLSTFVQELQLGTPGVRVIVALVGSTEYAQNAGGDANQIYVSQLYLDLLDRPADAGGLSTFAAALDSGTMVRQAVVEAILSSNEYRTNEVQHLYQAYLKRAADPGGLTTFVTILNGGGTNEQVATALAGSQEFSQTQGGGTNAGFLNALYQDALGRPVDANGLAAWENALAQSTTRGQVATAIFGSSEYRQDLVQNFYERFLHRPADMGGLATFTNLLASGAPDEALIAQLVESLEYYDEA